MDILFYFCFSLFLSLTYNQAIYRLEYKIPLDTLRLRRIEQNRRRKVQLNHKIDKLNNRVFKKDKQKARAFKKIERMKKVIRQIENDLHYLENYGEK